MDDGDRRALERLKRDQEYRDFIEARRRDNWRRFKRATVVLGALLALATLVAQLLYLLGLSAHAPIQSVPLPGVPPLG